MNESGGRGRAAGADVDVEWIERLVAILVAAGDPQRAQAQQRYMKSAMPYHGITSVELSGLLRPLQREAARWDRPTLEATGRSLWDGATHREQRYAAISVTGLHAFREWQDLSMLVLYQHFVVTGAWWDYVDDIASHRVGPLVRSIGDPAGAVVAAWANATDRQGAMWLRRTAILHQLGAKERTDTEMLTATISANLAGSPFAAEFFIRKAIGWALRQYAWCNPDWVINFVDAHHHQLAPLSRREALKHLGR